MKNNSHIHENVMLTERNTKIHCTVKFVQSSEICALLPFTSFISMTFEVNVQLFWFPTTKGSVITFPNED